MGRPVTLTLTCGGCGHSGEWSAATFAAVSSFVKGLGWDIRAPRCPACFRADTEAEVS